VKKTDLRDRTTIALTSGIFFFTAAVAVELYLIIQNDEIQQAQERKEKGLSERKAKSRKSEAKKHQRHRYQLCSKVYVQVWYTRQKMFADKPQQSSSNSKVSPKPVAKPAHSSTTTFRSSTAKTTISEKMLSLFSLTQSPKLQRLGRSLLQLSSPKLSL
jgi:hypothetical protein